MKRLLLTALFVILVASAYYFRGIVFGLGSLAFDKATPAKPAPARPPTGQPVLADVAVEMPVPIQVTAIGTVQPIATVMIKSRVDGEIAQVHFKEGQEVKEGDLLFTIDDRAFAAQLEQSEATLERDRASLQRAQLEIRRQSQLATRGVASLQKFEDTQTSLAVLEATVRAGEAAVKNARINLTYTRILAPIDGRTGSVALKQGNMVKAIVFIDNQVDVATGTISLKAEFANDDTRLWPGQFVNVTLTLGVQANAVLVPSAAIQIGQNGPYVFVVKQDSTVELRLVRVNRTVNDKSVIDAGLKDAERVVIDGQLRLNNGTRVAIQKPEGTTPPAAQPVPVAER